RTEIKLRPDGRFAWPVRDLGIEPDAFSIEKLTVEDGSLTLRDLASDAATTLDRFAFSGDVRSLVGPIRGEGAFVAAGLPHSFRVGAGRAAANGDMKFKLTVERGQQPLSIDADGTLGWAGGSPRFDGAVVFAREAGVALVDGRAVANEPWRITARVKASTASAAMDQLELSYGLDERALKLAGTAEMTFGATPRVDAKLATRQLDLDKFVALPDSVKRLPAYALRTAFAMLESKFVPPVPVRIDVAVDAVTLGESLVQNLRGDMRSDSGGWNIETVEFRAPGAARIHASGRLTVSPDGYAFTGPAGVEAGDPRWLAAWLEGRPVPSGPMTAPLRANGEVTYTGQRFAIEGLNAEIERKPVTGRFSYAWPSETQPKPRLEAEIA
ncbi:MAG: hypothetical protein J0H62_11190, partial [Rhizobiales bacterium]|nr:hypothetical protein [Hyphomicrobiales bacterium]